MRGDQLAMAVYGHPWAILPAKGEAVAEFVRRRLAGEAVPAAGVEAAAKQLKPKPQRKDPKGVGVVPVYGTITQRADWLSEWSGGTSCEAVGGAIDAMLADGSVEAIILDVDSPGGSVYGVAELGDKIAAASKRKKVVAVANSLAASAAYWLASQASEVVVTPSGEVGSIGVITMHRDVSQAVAAAGMKVTVIKAGDRKGAGHPYAPLDGEALAEVQGGVDDYYAAFVKAVARGRNVSQAAVREGFGRGGMVRADEAVRLGMADKVGTLEGVLARYGLSPADLRPQAASAAPRIDAAVEVRRRRMGDEQ